MYSQIIAADIQNRLEALTIPTSQDRYLLGFSLSFCIRDIVEGYVLPNGKVIREEDVLFIQTGCNPRKKSKEDFDRIMAQYCRTYWREFPEAARSVVFRLMHPTDSANGPRIGWVNAWRKNPIRIGNVHWVDIRAFMASRPSPTAVEAARARFEQHKQRLVDAASQAD